MSGPGKWTPPKQLPKGRTWSSMRDEFEEGVDLFTACWRAPIERLAIENPEMNDLAKDRMPSDLPAPQIVQPYWFGEPAYKATGFFAACRSCRQRTCCPSRYAAATSGRLGVRSTARRRGRTAGRLGAGPLQALPTPAPISGAAMPRKRW